MIPEAFSRAKTMKEGATKESKKANLSIAGKAEERPECRRMSSLNNTEMRVKEHEFSPNPTESAHNLAALYVSNKAPSRNNVSVE